MTKRIGKLFLIIASCLVFTSCTGLFTRTDSAAEPSLRIVFSDSSARTSGPTQSDVDFMKITILNQQTNAIVAGPDVISGSVYEKRLEVGTYYVVIMAFDEQSEDNYATLGAPVFVGAKENVSVTRAGTDVSISMVPFYMNCSDGITGLKGGESWDKGTLPQLSVSDNLDFSGWRSGDTLKAYDRIPDTTGMQKLSVTLFPTKLFYADNTGSGDGSAPDKPMSLVSAFTEMFTFASSHPTLLQTLILTDDVELPGAAVTCNVLIDGNGHKVTRSSSCSSTWDKVVQFGNGDNFVSQPECYVRDVIVDGEGAYRGIETNSKLYLVDCTIQNCYKTCSPGEDGGAGIYSYNTLNMINCTIKDCTSQGTGGAGGGLYVSGLYEQTVSAFLTNCTFKNCKAIKGADSSDNTIQKGGGIHVSTSLDGDVKLTITDVTMEDCTSKLGGCIYAEGYSTGKVILAIRGECTFTRGKAEGHSGGGIYCDKLKNNTINWDDCTNCTFSECTATKGGGALYGFTERVKHCTFKNCTATDQGGGYFCNAFVEGGAMTSIEDCTFTNCSVGTTSGTGGAICAANDLGDMDTYIKRTTITGCNASVGKSFYVNGSLTVNDHEVNESGTYGYNGDLTPSTSSFPD